jgi:hypothetical protein
MTHPRGTPNLTRAHRRNLSSIRIESLGLPSTRRLDLTGDGVGDCLDFAIVKTSFGKSGGQAGFDPRANVKDDGVVNILDLSKVAHVLLAGTVCN